MRERDSVYSEAHQDLPPALVYLHHTPNPISEYCVAKSLGTKYLINSVQNSAKST